MGRSRLQRSPGRAKSYGAKTLQVVACDCDGAREPKQFDDGGVGDMPKSPSSQYDLKAQEDIDPRGIRVTNGPMR